MKTIDTRDLYKRQQELQDRKDAVGAAENALQEAQDELAKHDTGETSPDDKEWQEKLGELENAVKDAESELDGTKEAFGEDEQAELEELDELESEVGREWMHGTEMIPEGDFEEYARQLAEDTGALEGVGDKWPCTCINWTQAAEELAMDYTTVSYQDEDYYVRA